MEKIKTSDIYLGELRDYSVEHRGVELNNYGYVFLKKCLYNDEEKYINLLNYFDEYPVYKRYPVSNYTKDGESYGTKIVQVCGEEKDGPCFVIFSHEKIENLFNDEYISLNDLEKIALDGNYFFKDFEDVVEESNLSFFEKRKYLKKHKEERIKLNEYLNSLNEFHK